MISNFKLAENDDIGRHFVAEDNFVVGDIIWEEEPLYCAPCELPEVWPENEFPVTCVGCLKTITDSTMKCPNCSSPCCSEECAKDDTHLMYECSVIAEMNPDNPEVRLLAYTHILYLRIFLSRTKEPAKFLKFNQLWSTIETGDVQFLNNFNEETHKLWTFLNEHCGIIVTLPEVKRVVTTNEINDFRVQHAISSGTEWQGDAVYFKASMFANGCAPNLEFSFFRTATEGGFTTWNIRFHAKRTIKKGDILTICYCQPEQKSGTVSRREKINLVRQFWCLCSRCLDPTEDGTYFQAVACPACPKGYLLPLHPTQRGSVWQCDECGNEQNASIVARTVAEVLEGSFGMVYRNQSGSTSSALADKFISTQGDGYLSTRHYLVFQCAIHWLFGVKIRKQADDPSQADTKLFNKVMERIRVYLPVTVKLIQSSVIGRLTYIVVEALTYNLLYCKDMKKIEKKNLSSHYKRRIIARIVENLAACLIWKHIKPNDWMFEEDVEELKELHGVWSQRLDDLTQDLEMREEGALNALQNLFL